MVIHIVSGTNLINANSYNNNSISLKTKLYCLWTYVVHHISYPTSIVNFIPKLVEVQVQKSYGPSLYDWFQFI